MSTPTDEQFPDIWDRFYSHINLEDIIQGSTKKERKEALELAILKAEPDNYGRGGGKLLLGSLSKKQRKETLKNLFTESTPDIVIREREIIKEERKLPVKSPSKQSKKEKVLRSLAIAINTFHKVKGYTKKGKKVKEHTRFYAGNWLKRELTDAKRDYLAGKPVKDIVKSTGRSESSIRTKASREGWKRKRKVKKK